MPRKTNLDSIDAILNKIGKCKIKEPISRLEFDDIEEIKSDNYIQRGSIFKNAPRQKQKKSPNMSWDGFTKIAFDK